jgi:hypothetical protein
MEFSKEELSDIIELLKINFTALKAIKLNWEDRDCQLFEVVQLNDKIQCV